VCDEHGIRGDGGYCGDNGDNGAHLDRINVFVLWLFQDIYNCRSPASAKIFKKNPALFLVY